MSCVLRPLPWYRMRISIPVNGERVFPEVQALQIRDMTLMPRDTMLIIPHEQNIPPFEVSAEWVAEHKPCVGGYIVYEGEQTVTWFCEQDEFRVFRPIENKSDS